MTVARIIFAIFCIVMAIGAYEEWKIPKREPPDPRFKFYRKQMYRRGGESREVIPYEEAQQTLGFEKTSH